MMTTMIWKARPMRQVEWDRPLPVTLDPAEVGPVKVFHVLEVECLGMHPRLICRLFRKTMTVQERVYAVLPLLHPLGNIMLKKLSSLEQNRTN